MISRNSYVVKLVNQLYRRQVCNETIAPQDTDLLTNLKEQGDKCKPSVFLSVCTSGRVPYSHFLLTYIQLPFLQWGELSKWQGEKGRNNCLRCSLDEYYYWFLESGALKDRNSTQVVTKELRKLEKDEKILVVSWLLLSVTDNGRMSSPYMKRCSETIADKVLTLTIKIQDTVKGFSPSELEVPDDVPDLAESIISLAVTHAFGGFNEFQFTSLFRTHIARAVCLQLNSEIWSANLVSILRKLANKMNILSLLKIRS